MAREYSDFLDEVQPIGALTQNELGEAYDRARHDLETAENMAQESASRHTRAVAKIRAWVELLRKERARRGIEGAA